MRIPNLVLSTIILFISNLIVRILGFLYKIFLSRVMGDVGLGIYHMVFNFLMICIALTTTGIPTALSCLVAKESALKDKKDANIFFISTLYVAFFISLLISLLVSFNSTYLSFKLLQDENLNLFILSICPAIVIITISNVLRGYFYGIKKVIVPAVGQIIEQVTRILFVFLLAMYISDKAMICYITLLGISIGEATNVIYMSICLYKESSLYNKFTIRLRDFYYSSMETLKMALPITCNKMSSVVLQSVSSMMVPSRLVLSGISYTQSIGLYGVVCGMVMPFVYLPFTIGSALVVNLIPSISQEVALNKIRNVKIKIYYAVALTVGVGILSALFFYFFGEELCLIVFNNKTAGIYLKSMFLAPLFLSLNQTLSGILHSIRKEIISSVNTIIGMVIQVIAIYFLLPIPSLNMYAYIYAITATSIFTTLLHSIVLIKALKKM
ncbi:polysaccharide biosynthesis protein [Terrisporobacter mayombei]|uniref:Stage V sporulation protein B n=1 Tax=Terrisporobacter mayombei TaxID=1541 RepID=A0ABY9Q450_9FIRM|nr:polysaccharide biosynthesis protein [Terrisporobacter mayombei]MCC3867679.1 polysaccharide biosynthesis protein [Terrisporobacter mayombei]WMT81941.1 Stage V sporulation protein B [Terrisporobacter mayombei]